MARYGAKWTPGVHLESCGSDGSRSGEIATLEFGESHAHG